jgi:23S rRNA pseudouridine1911/1915/1917 synthase
VQKDYLAIVHGHVRDESGIIDAPLGKDEHSKVAIKDWVRADGSPAKTEYWVDRRFSRRRNPADGQVLPFTVLRVQPHTGRKHQIRIHLAHLGHSIVGDKLYGEDEDLYLALVERRLTEEQRGRLLLPHHALHAGRVQFVWRGKIHEYRAEPEDWFKSWITND